MLMSQSLSQWLTVCVSCPCCQSCFNEMKCLLQSVDWASAPDVRQTYESLSFVFMCCRVISRAPGLKLVVETLITSLRPIGNIVLICCAFFIVFGILGVQVNVLSSSTVRRR